MKNLINVMKKNNKIVAKIWRYSDHKLFDSFRVYYMGTENKELFPNGVVYEGVSQEPLKFRGSSAANDSLIPTLDNFL